MFCLFFLLRLLFLHNFIEFEICAVLIAQTLYLPINIPAQNVKSVLSKIFEYINRKTKSTNYIDFDILILIL